jgi:hypothetical protein
MGANAKIERHSIHFNQAERHLYDENRKGVTFNTDVEYISMRANLATAYEIRTSNLIAALSFVDEKTATNMKKEILSRLGYL